MNEQIKKLANQAGFVLWKNESWNPGDTVDWSCRYDDELEKFAELIVRECAELFVDQRYMILNPHEPFANERVRALKEHDKDTVKKIKKHFGVEE